MGPAERKAQHGQSRGGDQGPGAVLLGAGLLGASGTDRARRQRGFGTDRRQENDGGTAK